MDNLSMPVFKICSQCKIPKELDFFYGVKSKKSACKQCELEIIFDKKQLVLAERFAFEDLDISLCGCNNYFVNRIVKKDGRVEFRETCKGCAMKSNSEKYVARKSLTGVLEAKDLFIVQLQKEIFLLKQESCSCYKNIG